MIYCVCPPDGTDTDTLRCPRCGSLRWRSGQPLTGTSTDGYVTLPEAHVLGARSTTHGRTQPQQGEDTNG